MEHILNITGGDYVRTRMNRHEYWSNVFPLFQKFDILLTPVLAVPPLNIELYGGNEVNGQKVHPILWMPFTYAFHVTGQPAPSIICGFTDDALLFGLQIIGRK